MLSPATVTALADRGHVLPPLVLRGWELWPDAVPVDVADAVLAVHDRADGLAAQFATHETTLTHGDLRLANLGISADAVSLIDWGALTAVAPSALDWAVYLATDIQRIDATHDEFLDDIRVAEGDRHDAEALSLALLGVLAIMGWNKALDLFDVDDEAWRAQQRADLDWWVPADPRRARDLVAPGTRKPLSISTPVRRRDRCPHLAVTGDVGGAVGAHEHDPHAAGCRRLSATAGATSPAASTSVTGTPCTRASAARSMPCGVPNSVSKCSGRSACGRNEKMPPPSLSTTTNVASRPRSRAPSRPLLSCRKQRSPSNPTVGPPEPAAMPSTVDTKPSMPFTPRLA